METVPKHGYRFSADVRVTIPSDKSSAEPLSANDASRSSTKVWLAGATVTAALLAVVAFLTIVREPRTGGVRTSPALAVPLTAYPGDERAPSLSPDGSRIAFAWNGPALNNYDIYVKLAGPGEPVRLTTNTARDDSPVWSPDGRFIAFIRFTSPDTADLIVIPALGGAERTIATIVPVPIPPSFRPISNLSWTPDARWLAFGGATSSDGPRGIWLIAVDGSEQRRRLTEPPGGGHAHSPVVSPDGRNLAFLRATTVGRVAIFLVPLAPGPALSGTPRELTYGDYGVWASPGRRRGANSCFRLADISALHGQQGSGWRTRVDRLAPNPSRSASRPPGSASPGQAGSCIQHRSEIRRFTSLRSQGHRRVRSCSPPSTRPSTNTRLPILRTGNGSHSRRRDQERRRSGLRTGTGQIRCR